MLAYKNLVRTVALCSLSFGVAFAPPECPKTSCGNTIGSVEVFTGGWAGLSSQTYRPS